MKKTMSIILCIVMLLCAFSSAIPSFALSYNDFTYEIVDGSVVITGYTGSATTLTIPSQIDGKNVEKIGDNAFKDNKKITGITVNSGVKDIGDNAFENCIALKTINLPDTIIHIGEKAVYNTAFYNNESNWKPKKSSSSGDLSVGGSGTQETVSWEDILAQNLDYLYLGKYLIEITYSGSYSVKSGTRVIADGAFLGCDATTVTLPNTLVAIGARAFKDCQSLDTINFSDGLCYIGDSAFENCVSLKQIQLPHKNIQMSASVFYNTGYYNNSDNWRENVLYCGDKVIGVSEVCDTIKIQDGATEIISGALLDKNVIIPESVTQISDKAFTDKTNVIIWGFSDSYVQEYADLNQIEFIAIDTFEKGDLNFDKIIDDDDYKIICDLCATLREETHTDEYIGDLDGDGAVDGFDAIILDLIRNGKPPSRQKGDVNGDGKIDMTDYDLLVSIISLQDRITDNIMFARCDMNEDGAVDAFDVVGLDLYLNNLMPII